MTTRLDVLIDADTRGVSSGIDSASSDFGRLGSVAKTAGVAVAAGVAVGATALVKFGADAVSAAAELEKALNRSDAVFEQSSPVIEKWAQDAAEDLGLSENAALTAAAQFGNMFTQFGQTSAEAAGTSTQIVQLATDLAAFNGLETADVMDRISASFRGEYDSLQLLIPNITAARIEKEALAASGKDSADALTAEEKALAALNIVMEDGAQAAGAYQSESNKLGREQDELRAKFENVKTELGQKLLPVVEDFLSFVNEEAIPTAAEWGAKFEDKVGPAIKSTARFIENDLMPALKDLGPEFRKTADVVGDTVKEVDDLVESFGDLFGEIDDDEGGKVIAAFIGTHLKLLLGTVAAIAAQVGAATEALDALFRKIEEMPSLGPLGGLLGALNGGGGGEQEDGVQFSAGTGLREQRIAVDVNLNNGIITDPYALGNQLAEALALVGFTEQRATV